MRRIGDEERRARLVTRHNLATKAADPYEACNSMVALHSSDPATVFLSLWARSRGFTPAELEGALYEERSLVRILGMRRTLWVVPAELAPAIHGASTVSLGPPQRKRMIQVLESGGVTDDGARWLDSMSKKTLAALERRGEATARELTEDVPELKAKITAYKKDGSVVGQFGVSTRVLFLLATEGLVIRARPLGTWLSSQYRWSTMSRWLGEPLSPLQRELAQDEIIRRWLRAFGPGTETDIKWWTGWPVTQVRESLSRVEAVEVEVEGGIGFVAGDDIEPVGSPGSTVSLLPSLDPTTMGWKDRGWYLGSHGDRLFDRNGNAGPTIWVDGRIVGGWAQRTEGDIAYELLEDLGRDDRERLEKRVHELEDWLGDIRVKARFRSPHDKEISASGR